MTFKAADLIIETTQEPKPKPANEELGFGRAFSDHMLVIEYEEGKGWGKPVIKPFGPIPMHPSAHVLHYGTSCFEGMKAYHGADGTGRLFRPEMNMARFLRSCQRLAIPDFEPLELLECIKKLLQLDRDWLPAQHGYSMYIRPNAMTTNDYLALAKPTRAMINVFLSPSAPYYPDGLKPIQLFVDTEHVRAWPGGAGASKLGSNYAPTIRPQIAAAKEHGCQQVLYLLPAASGKLEEATFSESGAMNMFFAFAKGGKIEVATPPLDGTILPGVTRDSIIRLCRTFEGVEVSERPVTVGEVWEAAKNGTLLEMWGCGTAAVVIPIASLKLKSGDTAHCKTDGSQSDSLTSKVYTMITDIQYFRREHEGWSVPF